MSSEVRRPGGDEILPITRIVGACIPPFLIVAFIMLFFLPNDTKRFFAWTIKPSMTPMMMGAGYISGSYYFVRLVTGKKWHEFGLGLLPIATFTWFMGLATFIHWDKFNHHHVSFFAWLILYVVTPILVPILYFLNHGTDPMTPEADDRVVPPAIRTTTGVIGGAILFIAVFMFVFPKTVIDIWPWTLTPLTCHVIAGWFALPGVVGLSFSTDSRWSAWRITLQSQLLGIALILIAVIRGWGDFDTGKATTWLFLVGMFSLFAYLAGIYLTMESSRGTQTAGLGEGLAPPAS